MNQYQKKKINNLEMELIDIILRVNMGLIHYALTIMLLCFFLGLFYKTEISLKISYKNAGRMVLLGLILLVLVLLLTLLSMF